MTITFFGVSGGIQTRAGGNVSLLLRDGGHAVLIDVSGNPVQYLERAGVDPRNLDTVVLTHAHADHIYALPSLIHCLRLMKREKPLSILSNPFTAEKAKELCACFSLLSRDGMFPVRWIDGSAEGTTGRIRLFPVTHGTPTSGVEVGFACSRVVYSADTVPCAAVAQRAAGARALVHEATNGSACEARLNAAGHSSARQAGAIARQAGADTLFLCHFEPDFARDERRIIKDAAREFAGKIIVPKPFESHEL